MKRILPILLIVMLIFTGCKSVEGIFGNSSAKLQKQTDKITAVNNQISLVKQNKIDAVAELSYGTDYSLSLATNKEPAVKVAKELNERVQSIVGLPPLEKEKEMTQMVVNLISNNVAGQIALKQKDNEYQALQTEEKVVVAQKDKIINQQIALAKEIALNADTTTAELDKYKGFMGLSAVFLGLKQFVTHILWFLVGGSVLFLILRLLATSNPIAGAIFSIFDIALSWVVNFIKVLAPKALAVAGTVETKVYDATKSTLSTIVDSIETVKLTSAASGKQPTIRDLLETAEKSMTPEDRALIDQIKIELGWVKPSTASTVPVLTTTAPAVASSVQPTSQVQPVQAPQAGQKG